jgi:import receptor subunit TOM70
MKVNALVKRACQYLQDEDVNLCLPDFTRALELDPDNADVLHHRGQVYFPFIHLLVIKNSKNEFANI